MTASVTKDKDALRRYRERCKVIMDSTLINPLESTREKRERIEKAKDDFKYFVGYYFSHYGDSESPDFHIKLARKVRRNKKYKGWLKWARGHAKSVVAIILLPLWLWINKDIQFLLLVGQTEDKAKILLSDLQAEFEFNQRLIHDFGAQKFTGSWEGGFFRTVSGFKAKAIGMGQDPRGIRVGADRPDYIVADDWESKETAKNPRRQDEYAEWFLRGVIPTMDNKNRRVLICQNHSEPRMIFSKIVEENTTWDIDQVNAYDPVTHKPTWYQKYDRWFFLEVEKEIGTLRALAEYNNQPHTEGKNFTDEMIQWTIIPRLKLMDAICGRWDVAYTKNQNSDYNAVRVWGVKDGKKYLIACFVRQAVIKDALRWIAHFQMTLPSDVKVQFGFESQFWNEVVYRDIESVESELKIKLNLIKINRRTGNKYDAMLEMLPDYQNGIVYYNMLLKSNNDTHVGLAQLKGLEPGYKTKDDAPDADKYCFDYLDQFTKSSKNVYRVGQKRNNRKY